MIGSVCNTNGDFIEFHEQKRVISSDFSKNNRDLMISMAFKQPEWDGYLWLQFKPGPTIKQTQLGRARWLYHR